MDLGSYAVLPTHYSLWTHQGAGLLRNWVLEGSKDGSKYTILREHVNDGGLAETSSKVFAISSFFSFFSKFNILNFQFSWPITPGTDFYRFLRIRMTGKSSQNDYYLTLSAFEVITLLHIIIVIFVSRFMAIFNRILFSSCSKNS